MARFSAIKDLLLLIFDARLFEHLFVLQTRSNQLLG